MKKHRLVLPPFDPAALCSKCGDERIELQYHAREQIVFPPKSSQPPCAAYTLPEFDVEIGEHMCKRCSTCNYSWMEQVAGPGPDYQIVTSDDDEMYPGLEQGGDMTIRKLGAATGEVISVENEGLVKHGAAEREWDDRDERALDDENKDADKDE